MTLPSIHVIRDSLSKIEGALVDRPQTSRVDLGEIPCVPISRPEEKVTSSLDSVLESRDTELEVEGLIEDEPVITFEIPPELDERDVRTKLGQHSGSEFEQLVKAHGTDAIGWYFPFHYQIAQHGIYISSKNLLPFALRTFSSKYSDNFCEDLAKKLQYAMHAVLRHELFHFAAECMAANWELSTGSACYIRARETLRGPNGYLEDEEALANAYMLRGFRWSSSATRGSRATPRLKAFCSRQPSGYNRGSHYVRADRYETGCRDLAFQHEKCSTAAWRAPQDSFDSLVLYPNALRIDWRRCPIILADEDNLFSALGIAPRFVDCIPEIGETEKFIKKLRRLSPVYQKKWNSTKSKLARSVHIGGLNFKPWPKGGKDWYSVRVDDGVRAHIKNEAKLRQWSAEEIGPHDEMGH